MAHFHYSAIAARREERCPIPDCVSPLRRSDSTRRLFLSYQNNSPDYRVFAVTPGLLDLLDL